MRKNLNSQLYDVQQLIEEKPRSQKEIADHFDVDRQTVRRAIDRLSRYTPLQASKDGRHKVYSYETKSIQFTPLELSTLILAQEAIISTGRDDIGSPFAESAKSLVEKVRANLTPVLRMRLDSFARVFGSAVVPVKDFGRYFNTIEMLIKAAADQNSVRLTYQSLSGDKAKPRKVAPYNVYFDPDGATLKLIGFDENRNAVIPFSIDHIKKIEILKEKFERPRDFELSKFLEVNCFNGIHGEPITVRLKVFGVTARIFSERQFHPSQRPVKPRRKDDTDCRIFEMTVARGRGLERFILSWLPEIEVVSPIELRDKLCKQLKVSISSFTE